MSSTHGIITQLLKSPVSLKEDLKLLPYPNIQNKNYLYIKIPRQHYTLKDKLFSTCGPRNLKP